MVDDAELTQFHGKVLEALNAAGVVHEDEWPISIQGKDYQLDAYLPDYHACVEADGKEHKGKQRKDKVRDALLESIGIPTLRVSWKLVDSKSTEELAILIGLWLMSVSGDIGDRRKKRRGEDALWD
mgnify:CR=1 FL=1